MNNLKHEKSPYLKQHVNNPVDWNPWSDDAFEKARRENKLIFLSIGYSTCHWCHVMEHESFERPEVAQVLNASFVSIKVDREERPDVDSLYMDAVQAMVGRGGWPMSVFLTPDLRPFYGGTYYPKETFISLLNQISDLWKTNPDKVHESGKSLFDWLQKHERTRLGTIIGPEVFAKFEELALESFDNFKGGKKGSPKFPPSYETRMLLRLSANNAALLPVAKCTLDNMAYGGIYDHLGGGFHRYSTDENWLVPHFEKMLYDQAAMAHLYLEAYQVTKEREYSLVTREILDYVIRDLRHPEGGFYSAEDADSEGEEGTFYVWSEDEIKKLLSETEFQELKENFGVCLSGNFEGKNILHLQPRFSRVHRTESLKNSMQKLKAARDLRPRPHRDEKILTAWNGLMIAAMARAGLMLGEERFIRVAREATDFILTRNFKGELHRRWIDGEAKQPALLEDYAFFIEALIEVYQATSELSYLEHAKALQAKQDEIFWDPEKGAYFASRPEDKSLIRRAKEFFDNVVPSGNSTSLKNLLRLSIFYASSSHQHKAEELLRSEPRELSAYPLAFPQLLMGAQAYLQGSKELVIASGSKPAELKELLMDFYPNLVVSFLTEKNQKLPLHEGKSWQSAQATYYVCEKRSCQLPTQDIKKAAALLKI